MAFDLVIHGGTVYEGHGGKGRRADVGVKGGRIEALGDLSGSESGRMLDAEGLAVCPGFINIHTHDDLSLLQPDRAGIYEAYVRQGITTAVVGNCGWSAAPRSSRQGGLLSSLLTSMGLPRDLELQWETQEQFHSYLQSLSPPFNLVPLAAHGPIRIAAMGRENRFSTSEELEEMKRLLRECMEAGCRGFSTGLTYFPGVYAHTDEIVELARICAEYGGRYATHVRGHSDTYDKSVAEAIEIAERSGCPLQLSHIFAVPYLGALAGLLYHVVGLAEALNRLVPLPGLPNAVLKSAMSEVDEALDRGVDIGMDFVPYVLGNTTVTQLYPPWANLGGTQELVQRLRDPATRRRIRRDVEKARPRWPLWDEDSWPDNLVKSLGWRMFRILSVESEENRGMEGKSIPYLAKKAGKDPFDLLADLTIEEEGSVTFTFGLPARPWTEKALTSVQGHPQMSVGADTIWPTLGNPPPSGYGCFPRVFEHYVRELRMYSLEEAIWRCTGLAASRFNLTGRGSIGEGACADVVAFDPETIRENGTLEKPRQYPDGVVHVLVNGEAVVEDGAYRGGVAAGRVLG